MRPRTLAALPIALLWVSSCSLTSSLDDLKASSAGGTGGTGSDDAGVDAPGACTVGKADCDGNATNGCEVDLSTHALNCGACGKACPDAPNADPACVGAQCTIQCDAFTDNCDGDDTNGCEAPVEKDSANCGACGNVCGTANTTSAACALGQCELTCSTGYSNCDGKDATGCEQSLDDSKHCGACGHDCQGGGCTAGVCQPVTLATGLPGPSAIAIAGGLVWVATNKTTCTTAGCTTTRNLVSVPKTGGTVTTVVPNSGDIRDIAVDSNDNLVLIANKDIFQLAPGQTVLVKLADGGDPTAIAVNATHVFWPTNGALRRLARSDNTTSDLLSNNVNDWSAEILGDTLFFYGKGSGDGVYRVPTSGGAATLVSPGKVWALAVDTANVYWTDENNPGSVWKAPVGSGAATALASAQGRPKPILADGTHVFWWNREKAQLMRAPGASSATVELYAHNNNSDAVIAMDSTSIYWVENDDGTLRRIAK